jgi:hypothetical protein
VSVHREGQASHVDPLLAAEKVSEPLQLLQIDGVAFQLEDLESAESPRRQDGLEAVCGDVVVSQVEHTQGTQALTRGEGVCGPVVEAVFCEIQDAQRARVDRVEEFDERLARQTSLDER